MKLEELTIGDALKLRALFGGPPPEKTEDTYPYRVGKNYFIRTVTHHYTGKLVAVTGQELVLENAAWIADDGRLTQALAECEFSEVEMFPAGSQVIVGRGSVIDAVEVTNIPASQK